MSTPPTILIVPALFAAVIASLVLAFFVRYLRNRGDLEWLGIGIIDEEEEERREEARSRAMRLRILGLVGEVMGYDRELQKETMPLVRPELEEIELKLEGGIEEGRKEEWEPLSIRKSPRRKEEAADARIELSVLIVGPREESADLVRRHPPTSSLSLGYRTSSAPNDPSETLDSFAPVLEVGTVLLRMEEPLG